MRSRHNNAKKLQSRQNPNQALSHLLYKYGEFSKISPSKTVARIFAFSAIFLFCLLIICLVALSDIRSSIISMQGGSRLYFEAPNSLTNLQITSSFHDAGFNALSIKNFGSSGYWQQQLGVVLDSKGISEPGYASKVGDVVYKLKNSQGSFAELDIIDQAAASRYIKEIYIRSAIFGVISIAVSLIASWLFAMDGKLRKIYSFFGQKK